MDGLRVMTQEETTQYIVIKIGVEQFGIDIKYVDNIVRMQHITRVPKVANYLKGVINLRGEVIPVMSLRLKMELEEVEDTKTTRIIILKLEQHGTNNTTAPPRLAINNSALNSSLYCAEIICPKHELKSRSAGSHSQRQCICNAL